MTLLLDYVNIMDESMHKIGKNTEILSVASKKIVPEVNIDKTMYTVMSLDQNTGRSQ
jgi:hypothetical protein